jgi:anthranilate phosphoribosyltransferase
MLLCLDFKKGGDAALNAKILQDVMGGHQGAVADALNLNAGVALAACQVASGPAEGVVMAQEVQKSGKAATVLSKWIEASKAAAARESS